MKPFVFMSKEIDDDAAVSDSDSDSSGSDKNSGKENKDKMNRSSEIDIIR